MLARQQMYMDVEAAHIGQFSFTQDSGVQPQRPIDLSRPPSAETSAAAWPTPPSGTRRSTCRTRGRLHNSLTLNLGLRYDLDLTPTTVNQYIDAYNQRIVARLGGTAPLQKSVADKNNVAPRLGVVWVPTEDRKTTLRSSFGFYYDQNHWNFTDIYLNETLLALRRVTLNANTQAGNPVLDARRTRPWASRRCARFSRRASRRIRI